MRFSHYDEEGLAICKMEIKTAEGWKTVQTKSYQHIHLPCKHESCIGKDCNNLWVVHSVPCTPDYYN